VQVKVHGHSPFLAHVCKQLLHRVDRGMISMMTIAISSVKVCSCERASIISVNNTVWIKHRNNFEYIGLSKRLCLFAIRDKKVDKAVHNERRVCFAWMHASRDNDAGLASALLMVRCTCRYCNKLAAISSKGKTHVASM